MFTTLTTGDKIAIAIGLIFVTLFLTMLILHAVNSFSSNVWFCRVMGWHRQPIKQDFDGISKNGDCPRCGKHVLLDSQNNWF